MNGQQKMKFKTYC